MHCVCKQYSGINEGKTGVFSESQEFFCIEIKLHSLNFLLLFLLFFFFFRNQKTDKNGLVLIYIQISLFLAFCCCFSHFTFFCISQKTSRPSSRGEEYEVPAVTCTILLCQFWKRLTSGDHYLALMSEISRRGRISILMQISVKVLGCFFLLDTVEFLLS